MKWFKAFLYCLDFVASTIGWIVLVIVLISLLNGGTVQLSNKDKVTCYGACEKGNRG